LRIAQRLGDQRRWNELSVSQALVLYHQGEFGRLAEWSAEMAVTGTERSRAIGPHAARLTGRRSASRGCWQP
jgi:hypothetical protein